ncbi:MAG: hypothetical protein AB7D06_18575 [Pedobacter sp.]
MKKKYNIKNREESFRAAARKNEKFIINLFLLYFVFSILIYWTNLGNTEAGKILSGIVSDIIPSISPTANISYDYGSVKLILSIAWLYILPAYILIMKRIPWRIIDWNKIKSPYKLMIFSSVAFVGGGYGFATSHPTEKSVHFAGIIFKSIKANALLSSIWGFVISLFLILTAVCMTCGLLAILKSKRIN